MTRALTSVGVAFFLSLAACESGALDGTSCDGNEECASYYCEPNPQVAQYCLPDKFNCGQGGVCEPKPPRADGEPCRSDDECVSGTCLPSPDDLAECDLAGCARVCGVPTDAGS